MEATFDCSPASRTAKRQTTGSHVNKPNRVAIGSLGTSCFEEANGEVDSGDVPVDHGKYIPRLWEPLQGMGETGGGGGPENWVAQ